MQNSMSENTKSLMCDAAFIRCKDCPNYRVYGKRKCEIQPCRINHENSRFSKMIMVSVGVSWEGKTNIHFIDPERAKVNSENYIQLLDDSFLCISARWGPLLTHIG